MIIGVLKDDKKPIIEKLTKSNFQIKELTDSHMCYLQLGSPNNAPKNQNVVLHAKGTYPQKINRNTAATKQIAEQQITFNNTEFTLSDPEKTFIRGLLVDYKYTELKDTKNHCSANAIPIPTNVDNGFLPSQIANIYKIPVATSRKRIAIIVLQEFLVTPVVPVNGWYGGFRETDMIKYFADVLGYTPVDFPIIRWIPLQGNVNIPDYSFTVDSETTLDIQVVSGVAKGAFIDLYVAQNTEAGFLLALNAAVNATKKPDVISCSWGAREETWTLGGMQNINAIAAAAVIKGITIFTASGNNGASDGNPTGSLNVDFPSSSPFVISCGGTSMVGIAPTDTDPNLRDLADPEWVWPNTGGGFSTNFAPPIYQVNILQQQYPAGSQYGAQNTKRSVPDISGSADPARGYIVYLADTFYALGGTSAVAPLYAAGWSIIGLGQFAGPILYSQYRKSSTNDIVVGFSYRIREYAPSQFYSIQQYQATEGFDICTGLGSLNFDILTDVARKYKVGGN